MILLRLPFLNKVCQRLLNIVEKNGAAHVFIGETI
jgi:hypothetical protein